MHVLATLYRLLLLICNYTESLASFVNDEALEMQFNFVHDLLT